ncbi:MAG: hypothetical protein ACO3IW_05100 [Burkholderiales bacterium]
MPTSAQLMQWFEDWSRHLQTCFNLPMAAPQCRPLWEGVMYSSAAVAAAIILWLAWKWLDYRLQYAAALKAQHEREKIADPEIMQQHTFKEAGDLIEDVTDPQLAEKIRRELEQRKLENMRRH